MEKEYYVDEFISNCILPFTLQKTNVLIDALVDAIKNITINIDKTSFYSNHPDLCIYLRAFRKALQPYIKEQRNGLISANEEIFKKIRQIITESIFLRIEDLTNNINIDFIFALASEPYEKDSAKGLTLSILPSQQSIKDSPNSIVFMEQNRLSLCIQNTHAIRKQLNLAKGCSLAVSWNHQKDCFETIGVLGRESSTTFPCFEFCGSSEWKFCLPTDSTEIHKTNQGKLAKSQNKQSQLSCRVFMKQGALFLPPVKLHSEVQAYMKNQQLISNDEQVGIVSRIISEVTKCDHGALLIFASANIAKRESIRLAQNRRRGMSTSLPIDFSKESELDLKFPQLTSIDGALILDFDGNCYAYGVILDGIAKGKGEQGRGARYNSAITYINNRFLGKLRKKIFAVVCSEDGMVDVIC